jgi:hypothetical protein
MNKITDNDSQACNQAMIYGQSKCNKYLICYNIHRTGVSKWIILKVKLSQSTVSYTYIAPRTHHPLVSDVFQTIFPPQGDCIEPSFEEYDV